MKTNLITEFEEERDFFIEKFKEIGWKQDDVGFIKKKTDFITHPDARNEEWQYSIGMVLYCDLLSYYEKYKNEPSKGRGYVLIPWVRCRIEIDKNPDVKYPSDCPRLKQVAKFMKEEIKKIGYKAFYDEDSYLGNFTRPEVKENLGSVQISFFLNKDYPEGYWENHTL